MESRLMMGKTAVWLRVMMLILALVGVVMAMTGLKKGALLGPMQMLGLVPPSESTINLCQNRIRAIELSDGWRVVENHRSWQTEKPGAATLSAVEMEKWLAKNCSMPGQQVSNNAGGKRTTVARLEYIDGTSTSIEQIDRRPHTFVAEGMVFSSETLEGALQELRNLLRSAQRP